MQIKHSSIIEDKLRVLDEEEEAKLNEVESFTDRLGTGNQTPESELSGAAKGFSRRSQSIYAPVTQSKRLLKVEELSSSESGTKSRDSHIIEASDEDSESRLENISVEILG